MKAFTLALITIALFTGTAARADGNACQIQQTSGGDYGVREYRASGWIYLVRGLTYEQAARALENFVASGRCAE